MIPKNPCMRDSGQGRVFGHLIIAVTRWAAAGNRRCGENRLCEGRFLALNRGIQDSPQGGAKRIARISPLERLEPTLPLLSACRKMIETIILEEPSARARYRAAPFLEEREHYLSHLLRRGLGHSRLRAISGYMLQIIHLLGLTTFRTVGLEEIEKAGKAWDEYRGPDRRRKPGKPACYLTFVAKNWFRFHGRLAVPPAPVHPFDKEIRDFIELMSSTHALSPFTVLGYSSRAKLFLTWFAKRGGDLSRVSLLDVDEFFDVKRLQGWSLSTIANHAQALRSFFTHAAGRGWCAPGLAAGIRKPALPKYDGAAKGPTWKDVRRMLRYDTKTTTPSLRGHAILLLSSIYALRSSEIAGLRLSDFDWREETFCVKRAKRGGYQRYPLQYEVGEAILRYLTKGRPRSPCRNVFVTLGQPYRPLSAVAMWQIVSRRFELLGIQSEHHGPHALRHACATHLLRKGTALKDIADFLGHRDAKSIGIYAKCDARSLRKVADLRLSGL
jgi:integrase/recombinase XerD